METVRSIAKAYYDAAPVEVRKLVDDFYELMKTECRGTIGESQFLEFTKEPLPLMSNHGFFQMLKKHKNEETLGKNDAMTMFYIIRSGRPFCKLCGYFIPGVYFTCLACFHETGSASYTICLACFKDKIYINRKCKHYKFIDSYSWLYSMQEQQHSSSIASQTLALRHQQGSISLRRQPSSSIASQALALQQQQSSISLRRQPSNSIASQARRQQPDSNSIRHQRQQSDSNSIRQQRQQSDSNSIRQQRQQPDSNSIRQQRQQPQSSGAMTSQVQHESNNQPTLAIVPARRQLNNVMKMFGLVNAALTTASLVTGLCTIL